MAHDGNGGRGEDGKGPAIVASVRLRKTPVAARPLIERDRTSGRERETSARTGERAQGGVPQAVGLVPGGVLVGGAGVDGVEVGPQVHGVGDLHAGRGGGER